MSYTITRLFSDPAFPFVMSEIHDDDYSFPLHNHETLELAIILSGQGIHLIDGVEYGVSAGDIFVIPTDSTHAFQHLSGMHLVNILFDPALLAADEDALRQLPGYHALFVLEPSYRQRHTFRSHLRLPYADLPVISDLLARMLKEFKAAQPGYRVLVRSLLVQFIVYCARAYSLASRSQSRLLIQLGEVISYLDHAYTQPIGLREIAEVASMSERTLIRRFKEGMGISPIEYIIRRRLQRGAELLREGNRSVSEVAFAVGFTDSNYFSRQFKRMMGVSPRAFSG